MPTSRANVDGTTALGATPIAGGATFRLWAPGARQVFVLSGPALQEAGRPGFSPSPDDAMFPLDDGTWAAFVAGLGDGAAYRFWVVGTGSAGLKRDPRARELGIEPPYPNCDCLIRATQTYPWHDDDFRPPAFNRLIQYQLHVGVYYAVDANGNDKRRSIGRLLDLLDRVEYLRDLGINAIQLLPIQEFATPTSRGYNGVDLFSPEMDYQVEGPELARYLDKANRLLGDLGKPALSPAELEPGPNQLKCVVDIFHLHGIAVMVDLVFNHAGPGFNDQSLWFLDRQPEGDDNRSLYSTDHEWVGGRAFAYWQAPVRQFLIDNARQCIEEYHADGIRYDEVTVIAANGGDSFCQDLSSTIRFERPETIQIAEYWGGERDVAVRQAPFGFGFDAAWSDRLRDAVRRAISAASGGRDAFVDIEDLARAYDTPAGFGAAWRAVNFLEDHDTVFNGRSPRMARLADPRDARSWFARSRARVGFGLLLAARGNPMIFMGQEILEDKPWDDNVGGHADLFVWWDGLKTDAVMRDYLRFCRELIWLRRREPALSSEQLRVSTQNGLDRVIAIHRWVENAGKDLLVVANLQELNRYGYRVGFPAGGPWREIFNSDVYDTMPNPAAVGNGGRVTADAVPWDGMPASSAITLPANGFIIFAR